jgi:hypothetical protein
MTTLRRIKSPQNDGTHKNAAINKTIQSGHLFALARQTHENKNSENTGRKETTRVKQTTTLSGTRTINESKVY